MLLRNNYTALVAILFYRVDHLGKFGRGHYEEHLCEDLLNLDQWFRRCYLKEKSMDDALRTKTGHKSSP